MLSINKEIVLPTPHPLSLQPQEGVFKRGVSPSSIYPPSLGIKFGGESKRGEASLIQPIPLPLAKGKGIQGIGLPKIKGVR